MKAILVGGFALLVLGIFSSPAAATDWRTYGSWGAGGGSGHSYETRSGSSYAHHGPAHRYDSVRPYWYGRGSDRWAPSYGGGSRFRSDLRRGFGSSFGYGSRFRSGSGYLGRYGYRGGYRSRCDR